MADKIQYMELEKFPDQSSGNSSGERELITGQIQSSATVKRRTTKQKIQLCCKALLIFLLSSSLIVYALWLITASPVGDPHAIFEVQPRPNVDYKWTFENPIPLKDIKEPKIPSSTYIPSLEIFCMIHDKDHLNIIITDASQDRFEIPYHYPYPYVKSIDYYGPPPRRPIPSNFEYEVSYDPFRVVIRRKGTNEAIFDITDRFVFTDLYIEYTFKIPTNEVYGLGERIGPLQFKPGTYSLFGMDRSGKPDPGVPGFNAHGHHPVYLAREKSGLYHINFLRNTNAQEIVIHPDNKVTWKIIGGVIDLSFFLGSSPEDAVIKYHEYIGKWALPALWHLGYHQSKWWGYPNISMIEYVLTEYDRAQIPLEALWSDIEYLINNTNFAFDEKNFPPAEMFKLYDKFKKRWIPVIQPYIPFQNESFVWSYPDVMSLTLKDGYDLSKPSLGHEFSGWLYFIDYFHPKSEDFWFKMLENLSEKAPLNGVWLDANEFTNFKFINRHNFWNKHSRRFHELPFWPGVDNFYSLHIVDIDSIHYGGINEYDVRSINGLIQCKQTYDYLKTKGYYFPFVLTRANMFGGGQFASHFVVDIDADWASLAYSMGDVLVYSIFGFPVIGVDVCGMAGHNRTEPELCARWYQLATFYTFARNHHSPRNQWDNYQEPYIYTGEYFDCIFDAVSLRYSLLKQYYALFFERNGLGTVLRPLFFGFHNDTTLPKYGHPVHEYQFLLGDFIMAAPVFTKSATSNSVYFPNCTWYDARYYTKIDTGGSFKDISAKLSELPPYFLRGGYLLFKQNTTGIRRSEDLPDDFTVVAALDDFVSNTTNQHSESSGFILQSKDYSEEYIYNNCAMNNCMMNLKVTYDYQKNDDVTLITIQVTKSGSQNLDDAVKIKEIAILGVNEKTLKHAQALKCVNCEEFDPKPELTRCDVHSDDGWINLVFNNLGLTEEKTYLLKAGGAQ